MGRGGKDERAGRVRKRARANNAGKDWWRKLSLPRRGKKDTLLSPTELTSTQTQRLKRRRDKLKKAISAPRSARVKHMAVANWNEDSGTAVVVQQKGNALQSMGTFIDGAQHLQPEEALFLVDKGTLDLRLHGLPVSLQHAWALLFGAPNSLPIEHYLAFVHLRRAGYVIRRAEKSLANPEQGVLPVSLSAWRVGAFKRKDQSRPLFHVAVFTYEDPPPPLREVAALTQLTGKTRVKIALIDRGVVVLTDMASNATPLSERFKKRFEETQKSSVTQPTEETQADGDEMKMIDPPLA